MVDVDFEEPEWQPKRGDVDDPENSRVVDKLLRSGIANNPKQANMYLIGAVAFLLVLALIIFAWTKGWI